MEIDYFQHPDSIWTWKSNQRGQKASLWIPYLDHVEKIKGNRWQFVYNGGELDVDLKSIDTIMLYGASGTLPVSFLDQLGILRIPMIVHRRNIDSPTLVLPAPRSDAADVMGKQIIFRQNQIKATYVARILVRCRFRAVEDHLIISNRAWARFNKIRNLDRIRNMEAQWAKRYWKTYYSEVGLPDGFRRESNPVSQALNACSFFLYGVVLRWILVHRMSPQHGFLHRPTDYPSLVYDLIEPYRYISEEAVAQAIQQSGVEDKNLTISSLNLIKQMMEETVYVPATRQKVRRKNLLHGAVLAMRAWLLGDMARLVIPEEGVSKGGRPPKVSYTLPGERSKNERRRVAPS